MLDSHCPASGFRCGYSGNFLACFIQAHPPEGMLVNWAWSGLGMVGEGEGRGQTRLNSGLDLVQKCSLVSRHEIWLYFVRCIAHPWWYLIILYTGTLYAHVWGLINLFSDKYSGHQHARSVDRFWENQNMSSDQPVDRFWKKNKVGVDQTIDRYCKLTWDLLKLLTSTVGANEIEQYIKRNCILTVCPIALMIFIKLCVSKCSIQNFTVLDKNLCLARIFKQTYQIRNIRFNIPSLR